ncbi:MAG: type II 3-dehydroquinate dehydratase [Aestuariivirga sp.]|uniref:type II 3-dehydroquinate dehydratase n=1 Tax=Aestuariivirga sp. TaxID=2650926 RepID=UPI0025BC5CC5|nr:type II 3-dehydroquinate dehydratase [Aestuariivirga sp.]MCA3561031.1 type II 3-dehydroquinate dehydratase [Aestuariivirga sp.]
MKPVFVLNGPNLNLLGLREPAIYGYATLKDVENRCRDHAAALGLSIDFRQSNHEGDLIDWIHEARDKASAIAINAGAYTHTSVGLHDALKAADTPSVELHLSNIHKREAFRNVSFTAPAVNGVICGFGVDSYLLAITALHSLISAAKKG